MKPSRRRGGRRGGRARRGPSRRRSAWRGARGRRPASPGPGRRVARSAPSAPAFERSPRAAPRDRPPPSAAAPAASRPRRTPGSISAACVASSRPAGPAAGPGRSGRRRWVRCRHGRPRRARSATRRRGRRRRRPPPPSPGSPGTRRGSGRARRGPCRRTCGRAGPASSAAGSRPTSRTACPPGRSCRSAAARDAPRRPPRRRRGCTGRNSPSTTGAKHSTPGVASFAHSSSRVPAATSSVGRRPEQRVDGVLLLRAEQPDQLRGPAGRALAGVRRGGRGALGDRPVEQAARSGYRHQRRHRDAARRLAEDRHVAGVAAERGDVVAHPLQRRDLVAEAEVGVERPLAGGVPR